MRRLAFLATLATLALAANAQAATPAPALSLHILAAPTSFSAADNAACARELTPTLSQVPCDFYRIIARNSGAKATNGATISLSDSLPGGLRVLEFLAVRESLSESPVAMSNNCKVVAATSVSCKFPLKLAPDEALSLLIAVEVGPTAVAGSLDTATVSIGGSDAQEASEVEALRLDSPPPFGIFALQPFLSAVDGSEYAVAGGHPYEYTTRVDLNTVQKVSPAETHEPTSVLDLKDAIIDLPPGLIGAATAASYCQLVQLASVGGCPTDTRVGQILTQPNSNASANSGLFNIVPEQGVAAEFGFTDALDNVHLIYASVAPTPEGYVVRATTPDAPAIPLSNVIATFFGNPMEKNGSSAEAPPMFTNPAECNGQPLTTHAFLDSWQNPGTYNPDGTPNLADPAWAVTSAESPPVSGCGELHFEPTIEAKPETDRGDTPTGLEVNLKVPQTEGAEELATPPLRKAVVTLPEGMTVNPSSANGLQGCSLTELGMSESGQPNAAAPNCPDAAKIGAVELETPALPGVLHGDIYVAKQTENPFHSLLAIYIVVNDPKTGVIVKLAGEVRADPDTGQLTTVVDNSPQFPFSELRTKFFGGQRAALRTPALCGKHTVTSQLTPWSAPESGPAAEPAGSFETTQGCAPSAAQEPNSPSFSAGTLDPLAGAFSPFVLKLSRADGSQELKGLNVTLPEGLVARLAGVGECSEAQIATARSREHEGGGAEELASPSCPASSALGTVTVGAGAGLTPYYTQGKAYLTGPYKGAPLGLAIVTPAVAGPYDLGSVVVRTALRLNPETAQVSAVSDEIPHILHGIPLDVRSITLQMSRHEFTLNPTNCEKKAITGEALSIFNQIAPLTNPFQVGGCKNLGFKPKLKLSLRGSTKRTGHPALKATLTYPKGSYANIASAAVTLPHSEFLEQSHIKTVCTRVIFAEGAVAGEKCPPGSVYGHAKATTPLLDGPVEGPVYLRSSSNKLPDLVAALNGQINVVLDGRIDTGKSGGIRNTFDVVPDAPVTKFTLEMKGGVKGLLVNSENLCSPKAKTHATAKFTGQNGKIDDYNPAVANSCKKSGKGGKGKGKGKGKHPSHRIGTSHR